jgi:hypothetical protein
MCYASICLATDYDVWTDEDHVDINSVMANVHANVTNVRAVLKRVIATIPLDKESTSEASSALQFANMTKPEFITDEAWSKVGLFLGKYVKRGEA